MEINKRKYYDKIGSRELNTVKRILDSDAKKEITDLKIKSVQLCPEFHTSFLISINYLF